LDYYLQQVQSSKDVDAKVLARGTPGFTGADLSNMINRAAIKAVLKNLPQVDMKVIEEAKDEILMGINSFVELQHVDIHINLGIARRGLSMDAESRKKTAYHEGGHALVSLYAKGSIPLHKVTIIPRDSALGVVSIHSFIFQCSFIDCLSLHSFIFVFCQFTDDIVYSFIDFYMNVIHLLMILLLDSAIA
jgi:ATP-dependent Zn protease